MVWSQVYDPFNSMLLSTLVAAIPIVVMLGCLAFLHVKAHWAAILGLLAALIVAIFAYGMPAKMAGMAAFNGALFGLLPIGWIVLNIIFLYRLTEESGSFKILRDSIANITPDRRLQLLLIAFSFGAFFEGAAGFGTPVAVTAAVLIGLGFSPLAASGLSLIANTAPVAYGALGSPVIALAAVTGLDLLDLSAMIGRQLPFFSLLVPFWLIWAFAGLKGMKEIWPAILVAGVSFAIPQYLVSNYHGPWLVDVVAAMVSMACLVVFLRFWHPARIWTSPSLKGHEEQREAEAAAAQPAAVTGNPTTTMRHDRRTVIVAWIPWMILTVFVFVWGVPQFKSFMDGVSVFRFPLEGLHNMVQKVPPVVAKPVHGSRGLLAELAVGDRHRHPAVSDHCRPVHEVFAARLAAHVLDHDRARALLAAHDLGDARARLSHPLLGHRCDARARIRGCRSFLPVLRHDARVARRRADRIRHGVQCAVRRLAEDHRRTDRLEPGADGVGQQFGRRDGQDDRRAKHRRRVDRDAVVRA